MSWILLFPQISLYDSAILGLFFGKIFICGEWLSLSNPVVRFIYHRVGRKESLEFGFVSFLVILSGGNI